MNKFIIPIILFIFIGLFLALGLQRDPSIIPSPLIGQKTPDYPLPDLMAPENTISLPQFTGKPALLNVWASWCAACRHEHDVLMQLARNNKKIVLIGLNYKDEKQDALAFLSELGNPYQHILADTEGRLGLELGVYGAPETFFISAEGIILYKHIGPLTPDIINQLTQNKALQLFF